MSTPAPSSQPENGTAYSLEILSELTGVSTQTILQYQEHGLIQSSSEGDPHYTDDTLRLLRRVEHLRELCEPNLTGLKMLTMLLDEVESLRAELRVRRW
jgi:DNA-binding transcriptional MerR regulator